jgi:hypothetical protein
VKEICEKKMDFYFKKAMKQLDLVSATPDKKQELRTLSEKLMYRLD